MRMTTTTSQRRQAVAANLELLSDLPEAQGRA
jgi:hypothetical protein